MPFVIKTPSDAGTSRLRILVVDDKHGVRELAAEILRNQGMEVVVAGCVRQGKEMLRGESIDILFTDFQLPDGTGIELMKEAERCQLDIPTVLFTGYASTEAAVQAFHDGVCDYIPKPLTSQRMAQALRRCFCKLSQRSEAPQSCGTVVGSCFIATGAAGRRVLQLAGHAAAGSEPVLIEGEPGVGKRLLAEWIHYHSASRHARCIGIECGAGEVDFEEIVQGPESFRLNAEVGTLLFKGIDRLSAADQTRLASALGIEGSSAPRGTGPFRIVATSRSALRERALSGEFRVDLYQLLNVARITIPPLRQRPEDIGAIAEMFLRCCGDELGKEFGFTNMARAFLLVQPWPNNAHELEAAVRRAVLKARGNVIGVELFAEQELLPLRDEHDHMRVPLGSLREMQEYVITRMVERFEGNMTAAARALGMHRRTLYRFIKRK